jgi:biotin carboxyl carrier protein
MRFEIHLNGPDGQKKHIVELTEKGENYEFALDGQPVEADAVQLSPYTISVLLGGQSFEIHVSRSADGKLKLQCGPHDYAAEMLDPRAWQGRRHGPLEVEGRAEIVAPMPGKVIRLLVAAGDAVEAGQGLLVVEAMKMQNEIRSPKSGKVQRLLAKEGQPVNAGDVLALVE